MQFAILTLVENRLKPTPMMILMQGGVHG